MKGGLTHLDQEAVFPFKLRYQEICEPQTIIASEDYNHHYVFQQFFLALNDKNELDIKKILMSFTQHKDAILKYASELDKYSKDFLNEESLDENAMAYYRKKLHFLGRQISSNIELKKDQVQNVFKVNHLAGVKGEYLTSTFQPFFENKFMQINDVQFFFEEARDFAKSEMDLGKDYFKRELCGVKKLLFQVIEYYTQPPKNMSSTHLYHGDAIPLTD